MLSGGGESGIKKTSGSLVFNTIAKAAKLKSALLNLDAP